MNSINKIRLARSFYARPARVVAVDLLGKRLVRLIDGERVSGMIVETEAYCDAEGERDLACHGDRVNNGRPTPRTAVMFGPAGFSYVYFTYGMHWMFNIVTGSEQEASAVLVRALEPAEGLGVMHALRRRPEAELTNGPAKLAQALGISGVDNGRDLCDPDGLIWIENDRQIAVGDVASGPRIGLGKTPEPWLSVPWRYWLRGNRYVSR
jgi:DNA-3-methyladenine glycosylase